MTPVTASTTTSALTPDQAGRVNRARQALAETHGTDAYGLACRVGQLEWWLGEMIALVGQLTETGTA